MKHNERDKLSAHFRRRAIAFVVSGAAAAATANANPSGNEIPACPTDRPILVRQTGEAKFLHDTIDGKTLVYIDPNPGARLVILDLTDPTRFKGEVSVDLEASEPFESFFPFVNKAELVWLRQRNMAAALSRIDDSTLRTAQALALQGPIAALRDINGFNGMEAPGIRDRRSVEPINLQELNRPFDVKRVGAKTTHAEADAIP